MRNSGLHFLTEVTNSQNSKDSEGNNSGQENNLMNLLSPDSFLCSKEARTNLYFPLSLVYLTF